MSSIDDVQALLQKVEEAVKGLKVSTSDKAALENVILKTMEIHAELYAKYISIEKS
ncbi:MAG: hypothetical protein ACP5HQ_03695 [Thermoprotei archaeon]